MKKSNEHISITLRPWKTSDLEDYAYWLEDHHLWHTLDGPYYKKATRTQIQNKIDALNKKINSNDTIQSQPIVNIKSDKIIGTCSWYWISQETNWPAIGIVIFNPEFWGKGLGYNALKLWCSYLFQEHSFERLDMRTWSGNHGMIKLAQKLNFKQEACFRKARIVDGQYYDSLGFGILKDEWLKNTI